MYARNVNPDLEKLRQEALETLNAEATASNIHPAASKIHVSYLFELESRPLLQKLCLLISATASGKLYGDWQKFAAHLGLMTEQIRCIDYDFKGLQDPTYYVLLTFAQSSDATMDKIFMALQKIERFDVISRSMSCFNEFVEIILKNKLAKNGIYQPNTLPRAPLVLSPLVKNQVDASQDLVKLPSYYNNQNINKNQGKPKYGSIIMLTFAEDGYNTAQEIAKIVRSKNPKIGVIILQEQEKFVYSRAEEFIEDCFKQVDYIVPILTEGYLNKINNYTPGENENSSLDSKYLRYIFSLFRYEYRIQGCINNRVRCIIPDVQVKKVLSLELHPPLQVWFRASDIDSFAEKILLQKL